MVNVPGRWPERWTVWRKLSLNTWSEPDDPTIYGLLDVDAGPLVDFLARRSAESGVKCTITHAVTRAIAMTLRRHPEANVLVRGRRIWLRRDVDVFHQVAMPVEGGRDADLSGATVRQADTKRVEEIARELHEGARAVRERRDGDMARTRSLFMKLPGWLLRLALAVTGFLSYRLNIRVPTIPRDPFGGVMVTSVGMFGIRVAWAPIVTFSRAPIVIVVGQVEDRPAVHEGQVVARKMLTITASIDHRIMDGYQAGRLAGCVKELLEHPEKLDEPPIPPTA